MDSEGPDDGAVRLGLAWLAEAALRIGAGTLHTPALQNLRSLSPVLSNIEVIIKHKAFTLNGAPVCIATQRTGTVTGAVLAVWTDDDILTSIE